MPISPVRETSAAPRTSDMTPMQMQERVNQLTSPFAIQTADDGQAIPVLLIEEPSGSTADNNAATGSAYSLLSPDTNTLQFAQWHNISVSYLTVEDIAI